MGYVGKVIENKKYENDIHVLKITFPEIEEFYHEPGQFAVLKPNGIGRAYSIANYPAEEYLEFCIKKVPNGKVSPVICSMKPGDKIALDAPFGDFIINKKPKHNLVFICVGTGIAPIKAMLEFLVKEEIHNKKDVLLIYGWREKQHPYFEFFKFLKEKGIDVKITGDVESTLQTIPSLKGFEAYICGSPQFVKRTIEICALKNAEKINFEKCIFSEKELKELEKLLGFFP
ncbi:MAG TPA: FAD-dependent oxidoreductase [Nanoarchaeota archaeon]|nr:FAD-dependent oxidoreductase [Nanoarchaeota archaeon]